MTGNLLRILRESGEAQTVLEQLDSPSQLLALQRAGVDCPYSLQFLLLAGNALPPSGPVGGGTILLYSPQNNHLEEWIPITGASDLASLPAGANAAATGGVLVGSAAAGTGEIRLVETPSLYQQNVPNPSFRLDFGSGLFTFDITIQVTAFRPGFPTVFGDVLNGRLSYDTTRAIRQEASSTPQQAIYRLPPGAMVLEVDVNGQGLQSISAASTVFVTNDANGIDQFLVFLPSSGNNRSYVAITGTEDVYPSTSLPSDFLNHDTASSTVQMTDGEGLTLIQGRLLTIDRLPSP